MNTFKADDKVIVTSGRTTYIATVREVPDSPANYYSVEDSHGARWSVHAEALKPATSGGEPR